MKKSPAYLLIELAIVLALVALLAGMSVNLGSMLIKMQVRGEAEKISALFMNMRSRAMGQQKTITISVDVKKGLLVPDDGGQAMKLLAGLKFGVQKNALGPPSSPVRPISSACSFVGDAIIFYPDGSVTAGALYLTDGKRSVMYAITIPLPDAFYVRLYAYHYGRPKRI